MENLNKKNNNTKSIWTIESQENNDEIKTNNDKIGTISNNGTDYRDEKDEKQNKEKREFESIKATKEFRKLLQKENKIRKDFHGNRDFYNLVRGIAIDLSKFGDTIGDKDKIDKIIKNIERNFGGIEYDIDIDDKIKLGDMENQIKAIKSILSDYSTYKSGKPCKVSSVFLMKKLS